MSSVLLHTEGELCSSAARAEAAAAVIGSGRHATDTVEADGLEDDGSSRGFVAETVITSQDTVDKARNNESVHLLNNDGQSHDDDDQDERQLQPHNFNSEQTAAKYVSRTEHLQNSDSFENSNVSSSIMMTGRIRRSTEGRTRPRKSDERDYNTSIAEPENTKHQHQHVEFGPLPTPPSNEPDDGSDSLSSHRYHRERAPCEGRLPPEHSALLASPSGDNGEFHEIHDDSRLCGISQVSSTFADENSTSDGEDGGNIEPTTGGTPFK